MKNLVHLAAVSLIFGLAPGMASADEGVVWRTDSLAQTLKAADGAGSLVMVDVFAEWCGPCQKYEREVFNRADVAKSLGGVLTLRVDGEGGDGPNIVKKYHVVGYPTLLFLNSDGTELARIFGFLEPTEFMATVADYRAGRHTIASLRSELLSKPTDNALRFELGRRLVIRGELREGLAVFKPLMDDSAGLESTADVHLTLGKYGYLRGAKNYPKAIEHLELVLTRFPKSKAAEQAFMPLARAYNKAGDTRRALETLDRWIALDPKDPGRYNGAAWFCFKNDLALPKGVAYAKRAVALDPKAAYAWDTLAEIRFKQGDRARAIAATKRAMGADPKDPYYRKQLKRFSSK